MKRWPNGKHLCLGAGRYLAIHCSTYQHSSLARNFHFPWAPSPLFFRWDSHWGDSAVRVRRNNWAGTILWMPRGPWAPGGMFLPVQKPSACARCPRLPVWCPWTLSGLTPDTAPDFLEAPDASPPCYVQHDSSQDARQMLPSSKLPGADCKIFLQQSCKCMPWFSPYIHKDGGWPETHTPVWEASPHTFLRRGSGSMTEMLVRRNRAAGKRSQSLQSAY